MQRSAVPCPGLRQAGDAPRRSPLPFRLHGDLLLTRLHPQGHAATRVGVGVGRQAPPRGVQPSRHPHAPQREPGAVELSRLRRRPIRPQALRRLPDGLLCLNFADRPLVMHADSPTHFYALSTDVQCTFDFTDKSKVLRVTVGEDGEGMKFERMGTPASPTPVPPAAEAPAAAPAPAATAPVPAPTH